MDTEDTMENITSIENALQYLKLLNSLVAIVQNEEDIDKLTGKDKEAREKKITHHYVNILAYIRNILSGINENELIRNIRLLNEDLKRKSGSSRDRRVSKKKTKDQGIYRKVIPKDEEIRSRTPRSRCSWSWSTRLTISSKEK